VLGLALEQREPRCTLSRVPSQNSILLICAIVAAGLFAAFHREPAPQVAAEVREPAAPVEPVGESGQSEVLPPNHPPIEGMSAPVADKEGDQAQTIVWKVPAKWTVLPNASSMRLATYRIPSAGAATDDAELTVVRAGGSTDANLQRWVDQFTDAEPAKRSKQMAGGLAVSLLEVNGTFMSAGMGQQKAAQPRRDWMLLGAVVETIQGAYFFKLTGPRASVRAAHSDFDALVKSIAPVTNG
jgi:hypothetical protein